MESNRTSGLHRREFIQVAAAGAALVGTTGTTARADDQPSETNSAISAQPAHRFENDQTTADILVETLIAWGATHAFGIVGDGINSIIEALRSVRIRSGTLVSVMKRLRRLWPLASPSTRGASGFASELPGPGAIHLLNGLYDAALAGNAPATREWLHLDAKCTPPLLENIAGAKHWDNMPGQGFTVHPPLVTERVGICPRPSAVRFSFFCRKFSGNFWKLPALDLAVEVCADGTGVEPF
jgi:hypothetical protein